LLRFESICFGFGFVGLPSREDEETIIATLVFLFLLHPQSTTTVTSRFSNTTTKKNTKAKKQSIRSPPAYLWNISSKLYIRGTGTEKDDVSSSSSSSSSAKCKENKT
jgi:hypothetical protein